MMQLRNLSPVRVLLLTVSFYFFGTGPVKAEIVDGVVAIVNNDVITLSEVVKIIRTQMQPDASGQMPSISPDQIPPELIQKIVDQKLIDQEAVQAGMQVTDQEVDQYIENIREKNKVDIEQIKAALKAQAMGWEEYREELQREIRRSKLINYQVRAKVDISESDLQAYYKDHFSDYSVPSRVKIDQILFPLPSNASETDKDRVLQEAQKALTKLKGGEDFQKVRQELNPANAADQASALDYYNKGELMGPLDEAAFRLAPGEISEALVTDKGYVIIRVVERQEAQTKELKDVRDEIAQKLYRQKMESKIEAWIQELRKKAFIQIKM